MPGQQKNEKQERDDKKGYECSDVASHVINDNRWMNIEHSEVIHNPPPTHLINKPIHPLAVKIADKQFPHSAWQALYKNWVCIIK